MKIAHVTLVREESATSTILTKYYQESIPFTDITWAPQHIVFHVSDTKLVAYRSDRVYELVTEDFEND